MPTSPFGDTVPDQVEQKQRSPFGDRPDATVSTGEDVARSIPSGLRRGMEMLVGLPGDVNELTQTGIGRIARALFGDQKTEEMEQRMRDLPLTRGLTEEGYRTQDIQGYTNSKIGEPYDPQTRAGRYTQAISEQVPGGVIGPGRWVAKGMQMLLGGAGGEFAGEMAEGTGWEDEARAAGGLVGGLAGGGMRPRPSSRDVAHDANVATLDREGVPITAGQRTGSARTQYLESELGGNAFERAIDRQRSVFTDAAMRRLGEAGGPALPENLAGARNRIGGEFDRLSGATAVPFDQQLQNELLNSAVDYQELAPQIAPAVENIMNRMAQMAARNGGTLAGPNYKELVTKLREMSGGADVPTGQALDAFRNTLDDAVERTLSGPALAEWQAARRQYANLMTIERAMTGGSADAASGMISPVRLRSAISGGGNGPAAIAEGRSTMTDLANAGVGVTKDLPQSGTAPRTAARAIPATALGAGAAAMTGAEPFSILGAAGLGFIAPEIVGETIMSPLGQSLLRGMPDDQRNVLGALMAARAAEMGGERRQR